MVARSFQRTVYRPGELAQFDLTEPRREVSVGHGQMRRGYLVTCKFPFSRALAGALVFSKEFSDIAWGMSITGYVRLSIHIGPLSFESMRKSQAVRRSGSGPLSVRSNCRGTAETSDLLDEQIEASVVDRSDCLDDRRRTLGRGARAALS